MSEGFPAPQNQWSLDAVATRRRKPLRNASLGWLLGCTLLLPLATRAHSPGATEPLRVLIVGGGPNKAYNQVAIESNVRYVNRLLPQGTVTTTHFADGDANNATVLYEEDMRSLPAGERVLRLLLKERDSRDDNPTHFKKPNLGCRVDGPSKRAAITRSFTQIARETLAKPPKPLLIYFTGHGSSPNPGDTNCVYDLWDEERISVRDMARQLARLPAETDVTMVMVQCHSGSFADVIFEDGDPDGALLDRNIAGFYAATPDRLAAGCTSEVNEADYKDFTSYFFAALTGQDRVGRKVTGADYNGDGRVGMDEAFCYTLANDRSIDVPICTSDVFLRRFVPHKDRDLFESASYRCLLEWGTPAQKAALEALAKRLKRTEGDNRLALAYRDMRNGQGRVFAMTAERRESERAFRTLRDEGKRSLLRRWPDLRDPSSSVYQASYRGAVAMLTRQVDEGRWKDLLNADETLHKTESQEESQEIAESHLLRFVRLGKTVLLAHQLTTGDNTAMKKRYARLIEAEGRSLLPSYEGKRKPEDKTR